MNSLMRIVAIIAYFLIFLKGATILIPFVLLLVVGLFTAEPLMRILILLADISLIALLIISFMKKTRVIIATEIIIFFILLLPLLKIFISFPFASFNYFLFLFPAICFVVFFLLSIVSSYRQYRKHTS